MAIQFPDPQLTTTSNARSLKCKSFTITRSDTTAAIKCVLRKGATPMKIHISAGTTSDAATTATISVGTTTTSTEYVNALSVRSGGLTTGQQTSPTITSAGILGTDLTADTAIYGKYAETGTASTTGGPWVVTIEYMD